MRTLTLDIEVLPATVLTYDLRVQYISPDMILSPRKVCCLAAKWSDEDEVLFFAEWLPGGYEGMLRAAHALIDQAEAIVGWNSASYDLPMLRTAFAELGLPPNSPHKDIDVMRAVKRRMRFMSNRLSYVAQAMGTDLKGDSGGIKAWIKVMNGDREAQELAREYCIQDVRVTEQLYLKLFGYIPNLPNAALYCSGSCPACGSEDIRPRGWTYTSSGKFRRFRCQACSHWSRSAKRVATTELRAA